LTDFFYYRFYFVLGDFNINFTAFISDNAVCKTVHRFSKLNGSSVHVEKICSLPNHCAAEHVGCHDTDVENEIVSLSPEHSTRDLFDVLQDKMATYTS